MCILYDSMHLKSVWFLPSFLCLLSHLGRLTWAVFSVSSSILCISRFSNVLSQENQTCIQS